MKNILIQILLVMLFVFLSAFTSIFLFGLNFPWNAAVSVVLFYLMVRVYNEPEKIRL